MSAWAKVALVLGVLALLTGMFGVTWVASACQEMSVDLKHMCWNSISWTRLLVPFAWGAVALAVGLLGIPDKRRLWR